MVSKLFLLAGLSAVVFAEPIPQAAATTGSGTFPTDPAAISSELASLSSYESLISGMPTLPASVDSVLATAVPTESLTNTDFACALVTGTPDWYKSLPADVKTALTSYESALESWYKVHSSELPSVSTTAGAGRCTAVASAQSSISAGSTATGKGASATASGTAGSETSKAGGAKPTGAIAASLAGAVGVLGLIVAL